MAALARRVSPPMIPASMSTLRLERSDKRPQMYELVRAATEDAMTNGPRFAMDSSPPLA